MTHPSSIPSIAERRDVLLARRLLWFVLTVCLLINGARLASSDEIAIYLQTEALVERGELNVPPDITPNGSWFEGRYFVSYEIGSALVITPWYLAGKLISAVWPLEATMEILLIRAVVSTMGAWMGGLIACFMFLISRRLGYSVRLSFFLSVSLVFSTFLLIYLKTILRDVTLAVCLLGSIHFLLRWKDNPLTRFAVIAGALSAAACLVKVTFVLVIPWTIWYMWNPDRRKSVKHIVAFLLPVGVAFVVTGIYNFARFGNPMEMGYHGGTSFPTPLSTGLYGLVLSPGKGVLWFAPLSILTLWAARSFWNDHRREALLMYGVVISTLLFYAVYFAWGGDGSWGPRYLVMILPLIILATGSWLSKASRLMKQAAVILVLLGGLVQAGGVLIYHGNYLRKIGEFPFTRPFTDPEFLYKSHFIPAYSPILGHWQMVIDNAAAHGRGEWPTLQPSRDSAGQRIPLREEDRPELLRTFDVWFMYAIYAGFPMWPVAVGVFFIVGLIAIQLRGIVKMLRPVQREPQS